MRPIPTAALTAAALLSLGACYDRKTEEPQSAPPPEAAAVLAGVDLSRPVRALGTEPFWSVEITRDAIVLTRPDQAPRRAPNHGATIQGTVATYSTSTPYQEALNVSLIATECSDGMSDRTYPLTARVEFGPNVFNGCAASAAAIMGGGETGPVQETPEAG